MTISRYELALAVLDDLIAGPDDRSEEGLQWWDGELETVTGESLKQWQNFRDRVAESGSLDNVETSLLHSAALNVLGYPLIMPDRVIAVGGNDWRNEVQSFLQ